MAAKSTTLKNDILKLIYQAIAIADLAENDSSSPITDITVALHTATPAAGNQATSEISYTGYARVSVARTSGGWTVTGNSVSPAADIDFGTMTAGAGGTATHFSTGTGVSNKMLHYGPISPTIVVTNGVQPRLTTATATTED